jgi:O-antigen/teichoic acid export membrane protein
MSAAKASYTEAIARGAGVNLLGTLGKALFPAFFVVVTRLYSPAIVGVYILASSVLEVAVSLTVSGLNDAVLLYSARYVDDEAQHDKLYRVLANGFALALGVSFAAVGAAYLCEPLIRAQYHQPGAVQAIQVLVWSLPFSSLTTLVLAATRARLIMKWDAVLNAFLKPALLLLFTIVLWAFGAQLGGMLWAWNATHCVVAFLAVLVFRRHYSLARLLRAIVKLRFSREMTLFAIPQTLNMTFNRLITNMDVMMLAMFGCPADQIGFYGIGSQIVRNIREVKLVFSTSYMPVIARYHAAGDRKGLTDSFAMVTRWITSIALPIALAVTVLREDLLRLFHGAFHGDTTFMLWLLVLPLLSCGFGLAGNIVVATGHSGYNLLNSFAVFGANLGFNWLLIPRYGMVGAAMASAFALLLISIAQLVEAGLLTGARLPPRLIYKPYLAVIVPAAVVWAAGLLGLNATLSGRVVLAVVGVALAALGLGLLGIDPRDRAVLLPFLRLRKPARPRALEPELRPAEALAMVEELPARGADDGLSPG